MRSALFLLFVLLSQSRYLPAQKKPSHPPILQTYKLIAADFFRLSDKLGTPEEAKKFSTKDSIDLDLIGLRCDDLLVNGDWKTYFKAEPKTVDGEEKFNLASDHLVASIRAMAAGSAMFSLYYEHDEQGSYKWAYLEYRRLAQTAKKLNSSL